MQIFNKKTYVVPTMQVVQAESCGVLAASNANKIDVDERYNYLCPHMPETRCSEYNYSVRHKHGIFSKASKIPRWFRISVKGRDECPRKNDCERYQLYLKITNENQH